MITKFNCQCDICKYCLIVELRDTKVDGVNEPFDFSAIKENNFCHGIMSLFRNNYCKRSGKCLNYFFIYL